MPYGTHEVRVYLGRQRLVRKAVQIDPKDGSGLRARLTEELARYGEKPTADTRIEVLKLNGELVTTLHGGS